MSHIAICDIIDIEVRHNEKYEKLAAIDYEMLMMMRIQRENEGPMLLFYKSA